MYRLFDHRIAGEYMYGDIQNFFKFCWLFQQFDTNLDGLVGDLEIMAGVRGQVQIIPLNGMEKQILAEMSDWLGGKRVFAMNIKEFCAWFRYRLTFDSLK